MNCTSDISTEETLGFSFVFTCLIYCKDFPNKVMA